MGTSKLRKGLYCTDCQKYMNGAMDKPLANMCVKREAKINVCYASYHGCPTDTTSYQCNELRKGEARSPMPPAPSSPPPAEYCHREKMQEIAKVQAETQVLMNRLLDLKTDEQSYLDELITKTEQDPTCGCQSVEHLADALHVSMHS